MKAWFASFELSQERLIYLLVGGLLLAQCGWGVQRWIGLDPIASQLSFVPGFWGIANPLFRIAILVLGLWLALSIVFTVKIRLDIRRNNYVRPKQ